MAVEGAEHAAIPACKQHQHSSQAEFDKVLFHLELVGTVEVGGIICLTHAQNEWYLVHVQQFCEQLDERLINVVYFALLRK